LNIVLKAIKRNGDWTNSKTEVFYSHLKHFSWAGQVFDMQNAMYAGEPPRELPEPILVHYHEEQKEGSPYSYYAYDSFESIASPPRKASDFHDPLNDFGN
jgi:hypothetical protein